MALRYTWEHRSNCISQTDSGGTNIAWRTPLLASGRGPQTADGQPKRLPSLAK
jgi:hypothetical protein